MKGMANVGLPMIRALTCVCVLGCCQASARIRALAHTASPIPAQHLCSHGESSGKGTRNGAARPLFQGEKCPFWSLSGLRGKFFLVQDSPPLPCSERCLYGAFQVPEELWEDFLFPFCSMAESQTEPWPDPGSSFLI